ncbi:MAG: hypothetical protein ACRETX_06650 [Steroidobacteraceae bacterium]
MPGALISEFVTRRFRVNSWLEATARRRGVPQSRIVRDQLEKARVDSASRTFMELAGCVSGPRDLSQRKSFTRP